MPTLNFAGNVEGRDLIPSPVDVIVTDGFTGNVALKTLEGALKFVFATLLEAIGTNDETKAAGDVLFEYLLPVAVEASPREPRGRAAARGRGHLRDQSRLVERHGDHERAARRRRDGRATRSWPNLTATIRPDQAA